MKRAFIVASAILLISLLFVAPATAQFRLGISGGSNSSSSDERFRYIDDGLDLSIALSISGEYKLWDRLYVFCAPLYAGRTYEHVELPIGAKYQFTKGGIVPFLSGGLGALVLLESPLPVLLTPALDGYEVPSRSYNKLGLLFHAGIGVEFGSAARPLFSLELRARRSVISVSSTRGDYNMYTNDVSILAGIILH